MDTNDIFPPVYETLETI